VEGLFISHISTEKESKKKEKREETRKEERCDAYLGASVVVCGRMRKSYFHACCSQIDTGTCDMCLTCEEQVRSTQKETGKEKGNRKTQHHVD
jgi:hypothetical protein